MLEQARAFLHKYVSNDYQLLHAEMVSTAMGALANHLGEDPEKWEMTGLIHDWDFDQWPSEHPGCFDQLQNELPWVGNEIIDAIKGHADLSFSRQTKMAQALLAADELSGLLYAYMKMTGSYGSMKISSIQKKLHKELAFAAKINRQDILTGIAELGIPEEKVLELVRDTFAAKYDAAPAA